MSLGALKYGGQSTTPQPGSEAQRGSAAVDFVLVGSVLTLLFLALIQLTLLLHVRNTLIDAASSAAHYGALADRRPADSVPRAQTLISSSLNAGYARDISYHEEVIGGVHALVVIVKAPLPVIGLIGFAGSLEATGHAALRN